LAADLAVDSTASLLTTGFLVAIDRNYIGPYRLLKLVRAGASCQIWEAISELDNRRCALKTLQEEFRTSKEEVALLKHEYTVGHDLHHPCVIEIYDFDVARGIPYLALEYFESNNLKQWLRLVIDDKRMREQLPLIICRAAEGLEYLHKRGWIHRDVKPDNFLVNDDARVKLIDFAIAERIKKGFAKLLSGKSRIQGTRSYMSPEQIRGESLDARSDVYSFGCMLFELLCGRPPFTGGNPDEVLQKHLKAPVPSVLALNDAVAGEFATLTARMMSKDRDERPKSMQEFLDSLANMRMFRVQRV
jgi:serine/threonine-protein kinase